MNLDDTIAAVSSPPGAAYRGIVRLSGPDSLKIAAAVFESTGPSISSFTENRRIEGMIRLGPGSLPAAAWIFRSPRSYTRQNMVELHTLGSPGVLALVMEALLAAGARRAEPGEFTARAFLGGAMDLAQVHGVAAMINARSDQQLQAAKRLLHGALSTTAHAAREELADLLSLVEGALDFADEPVEFITPDDLRDRLRRLADSLQAATDAGLRAERWGELPRVILTGRPNAGKSSLMNRLTGMDRAICTPVAGTTRDVLAAPLQLSDAECLLLDVAGEQTGEDDLEMRAQTAAMGARAAADVILRVVDASSVDCLNDLPSVGDWPEILVLNKIDLSASLVQISNSTALAAAGYFGVSYVSAATGEGCDRLRRTIEAALRGREADRNDDAIALMAEHRQGLTDAVAAVRRAMEAADAGPGDGDLVALELHAAADHLGVLVGQDLPDDLLGRIFSRFCIGK